LSLSLCFGSLFWLSVLALCFISLFYLSVFPVVRSTLKPKPFPLFAGAPLLMKPLLMKPLAPSPSLPALWVVSTTLPGVESARTLAKALVEQRLVACAQVLPGVSSYYYWEGALQQEEEALLLLKTTQANWPALQQAIQSLHPYTVPQLLAVPVVQALPVYQQWIMANTVFTEENNHEGLP
jgi:periplasmic divalent cation tolerance protein